MEFGFKGTIEDASKSQNFEVNIGVIHLKFSPSIIRLLSAVSASFAAANQSKVHSDISAIFSTLILWCVLIILFSSFLFLPKDFAVT